MDGQLFTQLYRQLKHIASLQRRPREQHADLVIVCVYLWAVIHDRPQGWGCHRENWTIECPWLELPSESRLSRRLNTPWVRELLDQICNSLWGRFRQRIVKCIDAKALTISKSSKDKTATIGPASGGRLAKGYKLHVMVDGCGVLCGWALAPLNHSEPIVARSLIKKLEGGGYLVGDSGYECNALYMRASGYGHQLVAPPKVVGKELGHHKHSRHRLRGLELLKQPIAEALLKVRKSAVERFFGNLGWASGGLGQLPGFVRTMKRVRRWAQGKLIMQAIKMEKTLELQQ
jgi:hypothetical protein